MRYCDKCGTEYLDKITTCADCGAPLISEQEWHKLSAEQTTRRESLRDQDMVRACTVGGRIEAQRLLAAMDQEGIPAFLRSFEETAFDGLYVGQKGWGEIWVAKRRLEEAKTILEGLKDAAEESNEEG